MLGPMKIRLSAIWSKLTPLILHARRRAELAVIGDSNTLISYMPPWSKERWPTALGERLGMRVLNLGRDGSTLQEAIRDSHLDRVVNSGAKEAIIAFGVNDSKKCTPEAFAANLRQAAETLTSNGLRVSLMTTAWVDFPDHYTSDRNAEFALYNDAIRETAHYLDVGLIDVAARLEAEARAGNWDVRLRRPGDPERRYDNIHYNAAGCRVVASEAERSLTPA